MVWLAVGRAPGGRFLPAGSGKSLLAVRIVFLDRVQNLQIHVMRANQYICIFSQFSEFRIQNMHSTLYVNFQSIFRNILYYQTMRIRVVPELPIDP